jgi:hypothetical protein
MIMGIKLFFQAEEVLSMKMNILKWSMQPSTTILSGPLESRSQYLDQRISKTMRRIKVCSIQWAVLRRT